MASAADAVVVPVVTEPVSTVRVKDEVNGDVELPVKGPKAENVLDSASPSRSELKQAAVEAGEMVNVAIRTLDKKEFSLRVPRDIAVKALKAEVATATSISVESQRLMASGQEMGDESRLSDYSKSANQVIYLVVRFPGASFAVPSQDAESDLPTTAGEESMMRSSRIVLRGTVTIPVPERDMHRVVHRILHRGPGSHNLQDLVSSMSYLPRYRGTRATNDTSHRRNAGSTNFGHRRRRRRTRAQRAADLPLDLRAHAAPHDLSLRDITRELSLGDPAWSDYIDFEQSLLPDPLRHDETLGVGGYRENAYIIPNESEVGLDDINEEESDLVMDSQFLRGGSDASDSVAAGAYTGDIDDGFADGNAASSNARATMVAGGTDSSSFLEGEAMELPIGHMAGKRKHSQICSDGMMEHRITARCRNLTLDDDDSSAGAAAGPLSSHDFDRAGSSVQIPVNNEDNILGSPIASAVGSLWGDRGDDEVGEETQLSNRNRGSVRLLTGTTQQTNLEMTNTNVAFSSHGEASTAPPETGVSSTESASSRPPLRLTTSADAEAPTSARDAHLSLETTSGISASSSVQQPVAAVEAVTCAPEIAKVGGSIVSSYTRSNSVSAEGTGDGYSSVHPLPTSAPSSDQASASERPVLPVRASSLMGSVDNKSEEQREGFINRDKVGQGSQKDILKAAPEAAIGGLQAEPQQEETSPSSSTATALAKVGEPELLQAEYKKEPEALLPVEKPAKELLTTNNPQISPTQPEPSAKHVTASKIDDDGLPRVRTNRCAGGCSIM